MEYIYIGKIVNTHGIKGEVRILSDFPYKDKIFIKDFPIYIGKDKKEEIITTYRPHKIFDMITMKGYTNINEILKYKGKNIYIKRENLHLEKGEYLDEDLIGLNIIINNKIVGQVKNVLRGPQDQIIVTKDQKEYRIPYVKDLILNIDLKQGITIEYIKGLLDE